MNSIVNPIAQRAYERALQAARTPPRTQQITNSRTADKFVIRGFDELFSELSGIGKHQGRSANSETVAAILEALSGYQRSDCLTRILKANIGEDLAQQVLAEVPNFDLKVCKVRRKFVIRFPDTVRDTVRKGLDDLASTVGGPQQSMNTWLLNALVAWVKIQRQQYALLNAALALDTDRLGSETAA